MGIIIKIVIVKIFILVLNFLFEVILLMYMKIIKIPPIIIRNVIIGNHDELNVLFIIVIESKVCNRSVVVIDIGVFSIVDITDNTIMVFIILVLISVCSLVKILILGIKDVFSKLMF